MKTKVPTLPRVIRASVSPDYALINAVLEKHLDLTFTEKNQSLIQRKVGPGNFRKIQEILAFTSNQDVWPNDSSVSAAADKVSGKLSQHFPALSQLAIFKIINQATYGWR